MTQSTQSKWATATTLLWRPELLSAADALCDRCETHAFLLLTAHKGIGELHRLSATVFRAPSWEVSSPIPAPRHLIVGHFPGADARRPRNSRAAIPLPPVLCEAAWRLAAELAVPVFASDLIAAGMFMQILGGAEQFARDARAQLRSDAAVSLGAGRDADTKTSRLSRAGAMLISTNQPVSEIARQLAFFDHAHFSRSFRQRYGLTPRQFRAALRFGRTATTTS